MKEKDFPCSFIPKGETSIYVVALKRVINMIKSKSSLSIPTGKGKVSMIKSINYELVLFTLEEFEDCQHPMYFDYHHNTEEYYNQETKQFKALTQISTVVNKKEKYTPSMIKNNLVPVYNADFSYKLLELTADEAELIRIIIDTIKENSKLVTVHNIIDNEYYTYEECMKIAKENVDKMVAKHDGIVKNNKEYVQLVGTEIKNMLADVHNYSIFQEELMHVYENIENLGEIITQVLFNVINNLAIDIIKVKEIESKTYIGESCNFVKVLTKVWREKKELIDREELVNGKLVKVLCVRTRINNLFIKNYDNYVKAAELLDKEYKKTRKGVTIINDNSEELMVQTCIVNMKDGNKYLMTKEQVEENKEEIKDYQVINVVTQVFGNTGNTLGICIKLVYRVNLKANKSLKKDIHKELIEYITSNPVEIAGVDNNNKEVTSIAYMFKVKEFIKKLSKSQKTDQRYVDYLKSITNGKY